MTTDYRALLLELVEAWESYSYADAGDATDRMSEAVKEARAALAQPEPVEPTDEELLAVAIEFVIVSTDGTNPWREDANIADEVVEYARAVLTRYGRPAITPIPVSELLEPEWVRQEDQTHKTTDHAQLIDGEWWAPCSDLFSMQRILDNARAYVQGAVEGDVA